MKEYKMEFRVHAIRRMYERRISEDDVREVIENGKIIEEYSDDEPYPSELIIGWIDQKPIHVVVGNNTKDKKKVIITAYEPSLRKWQEGFERRK